MLHTRLVYIGRSERCLRFAYQGVCYEFTVLPFGLSLSPRTSCLCTEAGLNPIRTAGLKIPTYKDDWLIIADSREKMMQNTARVLAHITALGFRVNVRKSNFLHSFLGLELNSITIRLSKECILSFVNCLSQFREGARVQYRTCLRLQGLMSAAIQTWCNWILLQRSGVDALPIGESLHSMFQRTRVTTVNYCFLPNVPALDGFVLCLKPNNHLFLLFGEIL